MKMKRKIADTEIIELLTFLMHKMEHDVSACAMRYISRHRYALFCPSDQKVEHLFCKVVPRKNVVFFMLDNNLLKRAKVTYKNEQIDVLLISELGKNFINNCNRIVNE